MWSRRRFTAGLATGVSLFALPGAIPLRSAPGKSSLSAEQRRMLLAALLKQDVRYDPFARMLVVSPTHGLGGHPIATPRRTGDVHGTRESLVYAAALLDVGERWRTGRAKEIFRAVIALQDFAPDSETCGLWPRSLEEPFSRVSPDQDSAGSCATPLLRAWIGHRDELGRQLADAVKESIIHSARAIQRQAVTLSDTSKAIMGTGLVLIVAQEFKLPQLRADGKTRLLELYDYVVRQGCRPEYNSPAGSILALQELSRMLLLLKDSRDRALASSLHEAYWKHIADHFHPPTQQWAGPRRFAGEPDLRKQPSIRAFLQVACNGKLDFSLEEPPPLGLDASGLPLQCPRKSVTHFSGLKEPRQVVETFVPSEAGIRGAATPVVGTTWLHPHFSIGSVNRGNFQPESRPLLIYWGRASAPRFLQLRCLRNEQDWGSGLFFSAQHEGSVLAVGTFAHNETKPESDPVAGNTVPTKDLRFRFEAGGDLEQATVSTGAGEDGRYFVLQDRDVRFVLRPVTDVLGNKRFRWESAELELAKRIDAVGSSGTDKPQNPAAPNDAFICFTFEEWPYSQKAPPLAKVTWIHEKGRLRARWVTRGRTLDLDVPVRPGAMNSMNDSFRSLVV